MEKDEISIELTEIGNGWMLHVYNNRTTSRDVPDMCYKTLDEALKAIPEQVAEVRKNKSNKK